MREDTHADRSDCCHCYHSHRHNKRGTNKGSNRNTFNCLLTLLAASTLYQSGSAFSPTSFVSTSTSAHNSRIVPFAFNRQATQTTPNQNTDLDGFPVIFSAKQQRRRGRCDNTRLGMIWKPPGRGGKGWYNLNERSDFDRDRYNKNKNGRRKKGGSGKLMDLNLRNLSVRTLTLQRALVCATVCCYCYQLVTAVLGGTPALNAALITSGYVGPPVTKSEILQRNVMGGAAIIVRGRHNPVAAVLRDPRMRRALRAPIVASSAGPFVTDFIHDGLSTRLQPHRYLTAAFLHGSVLHLAVTMRLLWTMPRWLESGLGRPLYLTTYLASAVAGNVAHSLGGGTAGYAMVGAAPCLGASGAVCGLHGLLFVMLRRMQRPAMSHAVGKNLLFLLLFGLLDTHVSNATHVGGLLCGALLAVVCGPRFRSSYAAKRHDLFDDDSGQVLRRIMGPTVVQLQRRLRLEYLWGGILLLLWYDKRLRTIPMAIVRGFVRPGSLSGIV